jgi:hypothetical protein
MSFSGPESNNNNEGLNAERFPDRAAQREDALHEQAMIGILEKQRKINNNNNNNNYNNNYSNNNNNYYNYYSNVINAEVNPNNASKREAALREQVMMDILENEINAELFPNNVSEREAELRMHALAEAERNSKPGMEMYMFNRAAANERYSRNVMNSILHLLPKREAIKVKEHAMREKYANKAARNEEAARLAEQAEAARLAEQAEAARLADALAMQNFLRAEALRPEQPGLRRANATINGVPGRRNYIPPGPGRRKSRKPRRKTNKTRRYSFQ